MSGVNIIFPYPDHESLGVGYVMDAFRRKGHDVSLYFYHAENTYLNKKSKFKLFEITQDILNKQPDIVAFSCVTDNWRYQSAIAREIKRQVPEIKTLFGGVHVTSVPEKVKAHWFVDKIITGDVVDITKHIPYKAPFMKVLPDAQHEYRIITSHGCPFKCSFCFNSIQQRSLKRRDASHVITELWDAKVEYGIKRVLFLDDCFTMGDWMFDFLRHYKTHINLPFACITKPDLLTSEKIKALKYAGCVNVQLGIQSFSDDLCKIVLNRKNNIDNIYNVLWELKKVGIMTQVDHLLGVPGDSIENQEQALKNYADLRPDIISTFWLRYYPKTEIAKYLSESQRAKIEQGKSLYGRSYVLGGDAKHPEKYYAVTFLMNWQKFIPSFMIYYLVYTRLYKIFRIKNYFLSVALPRALQAVVNPKDFWGRSHLFRWWRGVL